MDEPVTFEVVRGRMTLARRHITYVQNLYAYGPVAGVSVIQQDFAPGDALNVRVVTAGKWWKRHLVVLALGSEERTCCITCRSESDGVRLVLAIRDVLDQQRETARRLSRARDARLPLPYSRSTWLSADGIGP